MDQRIDIENKDIDTGQKFADSNVPPKPVL